MFLTYRGVLLSAAKPRSPRPLVALVDALSPTTRSAVSHIDLQPDGSLRVRTDGGEAIADDICATQGRVFGRRGVVLVSPKV